MPGGARVMLVSEDRVTTVPPLAVVGAAMGVEPWVPK
jgi:hypothetical protein